MGPCSRPDEIATAEVDRSGTRASRGTSRRATPGHDRPSTHALDGYLDGYTATPAQCAAEDKLAARTRRIETLSLPLSSLYWLFYCPPSPLSNAAVACARDAALLAPRHARGGGGGTCHRFEAASGYGVCRRPPLRNDSHHGTRRTTLSGRGRRARQPWVRAKPSVLAGAGGCSTKWRETCVLAGQHKVRAKPACWRELGAAKCARNLAGGGPGVRAK